MMRNILQNRYLKVILPSLGIAIVYFLVFRLGSLFILEGINASPIWIPTGFSFAMIYLFGIRMWPGIFIGTFLASTILQGVPDYDLIERIPVALGYGIGNTLEVVIGVHFVKRYNENRNPFDSLKDYLRFILIFVILCTFFNSVMGTLFYYNFNLAEPNLLRMLLTWWMGNATSGIIIVPMFLLWGKNKFKLPGKEKIIEAVILILLIAYINFLIYIRDLRLEYTLIIILLWVVIRYNRFVSSFATLIIIGLALAGTAQGMGPFINTHQSHTLIYLQYFLGTIALSITLFSVIKFESNIFRTHLKISESKYLNLYNSSPEMFASVDAETARILECNLTLSRNTGYSVNEIVGKPIFEMYHPDCMDRVKEAFNSFRSEGQVRNAELIIKRKDGKKIFVILNVSAVRDENGKILHSNSSWKDISDRKAAEEKIRTLNEELEQHVQVRTSQLESLNKELQSFTYSVSHDLKSPLRGIDGYSRLLLEDFSEELDPEAKTYIHNIRSGTRQMNLLIEDLLAYSRLEKSTQNFERTDPLAIARKITSTLKTEIESRKMDVVIRGKSCKVITDIIGLTIAIRNIIENALKFTAGQEHPVLEIWTEETNTECVLAVKDNGIGFDMQYHDKIFKMFQRLQRTEDFPGTGIGLAIVKKAMKRAGGNVIAVSEPGKGSTFFIEIPKQSANEQSLLSTPHSFGRGQSI